MACQGNRLFTRAVPYGTDTAARVFAAAVVKPARRAPAARGDPSGDHERGADRLGHAFDEVLFGLHSRAEAAAVGAVAVPSAGSRSMVIIEPEGQERSNPEELPLKWAAQDHQSMGKIITVAPGNIMGSLLHGHNERLRRLPLRHSMGPTCASIPLTVTEPRCQIFC